MRVEAFSERKYGAHCLSGPTYLLEMNGLAKEGQEVC